MPRGGLQIVSPATIGDLLVKNYSRELHEFDTISWQVLRDGKPVVADGNTASRGYLKCRRPPARIAWLACR